MHVENVPDLAGNTEAADDIGGKPILGSCRAGQTLLLEKMLYAENFFDRQAGEDFAG